LTIPKEDAEIITNYFDSKLRQLSIIFPLPSLKKFLADLPECMKKYAVGEVLELLNEHYP
jgi:hypothetical protein